MARPTLVLDLAAYATFERDLAAGGLFVAGCAVEVGTDCDLRVRGRNNEVIVPARVVFVDPRGAGLELDRADGPTKARLLELARATATATARAAATATETETDTDTDTATDTATETETDANTETDREPIARNLFERLRGLTMPEQIKVAGGPDPTERMALERIYGKNVWEALLRNSRLTAPEVTRLARMGTMPRVMLETILNNNAWLQIPEVRRALLGNPRLGTDQIMRVLRLLPKHELKLAATLTAYPIAVRNEAKKLLKASGG